MVDKLPYALLDIIFVQIATTNGFGQKFTRVDLFFTNYQFWSHMLFSTTSNHSHNTDSIPFLNNVIFCLKFFINAHQCHRFR